MRTIKDNKGRVWEYCDSEGVWVHGGHIIGCGGQNGSKWMVWDGDSRYPEEFKTLRECMASIPLDQSPQSEE